MRIPLQRVKAFTIMELTVAMLISAIVIGITYTALQIISGSYATYTRKHQELAVIIRLDELLKRDFGRAAAIYQNHEGSYLLQDSSRHQAITYSFTPDYVLRSSTVADTFRVTVSQVTASFAGQPVEASGLAEDNMEAGRIDALSFTLLYQAEPFPYHYAKSYSSENLINRH